MQSVFFAGPVCRMDGGGGWSFGGGLVKNGLILALLGFLLVLAAEEDVHGQLFGNRRSGSTAARRTASAFGRGSPLGRLGAALESQAVASVSGTERYIRGNRRATDFVGADSPNSDLLSAFNKGKRKAGSRPPSRHYGHSRPPTPIAGGRRRRGPRPTYTNRG